MSADRTTQTFWKLIDSCKVIVPKLQRDYAQGREHDVAIEQIRNSLIDDIFISLTESKPLVLNFIYGDNIFAKQCEIKRLELTKIQDLLDSRKKQLGQHGDAENFEVFNIVDSGIVVPVSQSEQ